MMLDTGKIFYIDDYEQQYLTDWTIINGVMNITSIVKTPYVWGEPDAGYVENNILYRKGIITVTRQLIRIVGSDYTIIAEGFDQYIDYFQASFTCSNTPIDNFKHHFNYRMSDECSMIMTTGSRFADPEEPNDDEMVWGDIDDFGESITTSSDGNLFEFVDVWVN